MGASTKNCKVKKYRRNLVDQLFHGETAPPKGCQIFRGTIYQKGGNIPNDHKIYPYLPLQDAPKFTQIGFKIYHLATLPRPFPLSAAPYK
jgi:hypothetical protein